MVSRVDEQVPRVAKGRLIVGDRSIHLTRLEELIIWCLAARSPAPTRIEDMIWFCYGDREDGGPLAAEKIVHVKIHRLREKLSNIPWEICSHFGGQGYSINRKRSAP